VSRWTRRGRAALSTRARERELLDILDDIDTDKLVDITEAIGKMRRYYEGLPRPPGWTPGMMAEAADAIVSDLALYPLSLWRSWILTSLVTPGPGLDELAHELPRWRRWPS
jgi:hypothetical protein